VDRKVVMAMETQGSEWLKEKKGLRVALKSQVR